jgi:hypothetical protein
MDEHADTGRWMSTECATSDIDAVRRKLYTLANKAGYSLRTESAEIRQPSGSDDGVSVLRLLVRTKYRKGVV